MSTNTSLVEGRRRLAGTRPTAPVISRTGLGRGVGTGWAVPAEGTRHSPVGVGGLLDIVTGLARVAALPRFAASSSAVGRQGWRLLATDAYEAWLLAWPPGSNVEPHDHGDSSGAFVVCSGELAEVRWAGSQRRTRRLTAGEMATVAAGVVHDVVAVGSGAAVSIHAYSPPLRAMRFYDAHASRVVAVEAIFDEPTLLGAYSAGAALHPSARA